MAESVGDGSSASVFETAGKERQGEVLLGEDPNGKQRHGRRGGQWQSQ